jgi:hypothetical protein
MFYEDLVAEGFTLTLGQWTNQELTLLWKNQGALWFSFLFQKG